MSIRMIKEGNKYVKYLSTEEFAKKMKTTVEALKAIRVYDKKNHRTPKYKFIKDDKLVFYKDIEDWKCGKCDGANVPEHSLHCPKRRRIIS